MLTETTTSAHTEPTEAPTHPYERAGLGVAPFRVIGAGERLFQSCPGAPVQAGGSCHYCGTGIRYAAVIQSADGRVFDVGMDCVRRVDGDDYREARRMLRDERTKGAREAAARSKAEQLAAQLREEQASEAAWRAREPELAAIVDHLLTLEPGSYPASAAGRALRAVQTSGELASYPDDVTPAAWKLRCLHAESVATGHVGTPGEKLTTDARYIGRVSFETSFGLQTVHKLAAPRPDGSLALITWKTATCPTWKVDGSTHPIPVGSLVRLTATVKNHDLYRGCQQTTILRPKFTQVP